MNALRRSNGTVNSADIDSLPVSRALGEAASRISHVAHHLVKCRLRFEADARMVRQRDVSVADLHAIGKAAECGKHAGIGLATAEAEARDQRKGHHVAAMGKDPLPRAA